MRRDIAAWEAAIRLFLFLISILVAVVLLKSDGTRAILSDLNNLGYLGAFIAGAFFTTGLTILPAFAILALLAETLPPIPLALIAGLGAASMDLILVSLMKRHAVKHVNALAPGFARNMRRLHTHPRARFLRPVFPLLGGILLAMPGLPDEIALTLMSTTPVSPKRFFWFAFVSKFAAVLILALTVH